MALLFEDDFSAFDTSSWFTYTTGYCYGQTLFGFGGYPQIIRSAGSNFLRLRVGNYNGAVCHGQYRPFQGTEIMTNQLFAMPPSGSCVQFDARIRITSIASGVVFGFFPYIDTGVPPYIRDEIDFEFIGKAPFPYKTLWLNTWNDNQQKNSQTPVSDLDFSQWNTYKIRWARHRIEWLVNDNLIRTETNSFYIPNQPLKLHLNAWVPDGDFDVAYDGALSTSPQATWYQDIDYVSVSSIAL